VEHRDDREEDEIAPDQRRNDPACRRRRRRRPARPVPRTTTMVTRIAYAVTSGGTITRAVFMAQPTSRLRDVPGNLRPGSRRTSSPRPPRSTLRRRATPGKNGACIRERGVSLATWRLGWEPAGGPTGTGAVGSIRRGSHNAAGCPGMRHGSQPWSSTPRSTGCQPRRWFSDGVPSRRRGSGSQ
jgi:hypothetical protein